MEQSSTAGELLAVFRLHYTRFESAVTDALSTPTDVTVIARLGDDLDSFAGLAIEVCLDISSWCFTFN